MNCCVSCPRSSRGASTHVRVGADPCFAGGSTSGASSPSRPFVRYAARAYRSVCRRSSTGADHAHVERRALYTSYASGDWKRSCAAHSEREAGLTQTSWEMERSAEPFATCARSTSQEPQAVAILCWSPREDLASRFFFLLCAVHNTCSASWFLRRPRQWCRQARRAAVSRGRLVPLHATRCAPRPMLSAC